MRTIYTVTILTPGKEGVVAAYTSPARAVRHGASLCVAQPPKTIGAENIAEGVRRITTDGFARFSPEDPKEDVMVSAVFLNTLY